jgi:hypothetical protein
MKNKSTQSDAIKVDFVIEKGGMLGLFDFNQLHCKFFCQLGWRTGIASRQL